MYTEMFLGDLPRPLIVQLANQWLLYKDIVYVDFLSSSVEHRRQVIHNMLPYVADLVSKTKCSYSKSESVWLNSRLCRHVRCILDCGGCLWDVHLANCCRLTWCPSDGNLDTRSVEMLCCADGLRQIRIKCTGNDWSSAIIKIFEVKRGNCSIHMQAFDLWNSSEIMFSAVEKSLIISDVCGDVAMNILKSLATVEILTLSEVAVTFDQLKTALIDGEALLELHLPDLTMTGEWVECFPNLTSTTAKSWQQPLQASVVSKLSLGKLQAIRVVSANWDYKDNELFVGSCGPLHDALLLAVLSQPHQFPIQQFTCRSVRHQDELLSLLLRHHPALESFELSIRGGVAFAAGPAAAAEEMQQFQLFLQTIIDCTTRLKRFRVCGAVCMNVFAILQLLALSVHCASLEVFEAWCFHDGRWVAFVPHNVGEMMAQFQRLKEVHLPSCSEQDDLEGIARVMTALSVLPTVERVTLPAVLHRATYLKSAVAECQSCSELTIHDVALLPDLRLYCNPVWWDALTVCQPAIEGGIVDHPLFHRLLQSQKRPFRLCLVRCCDIASLTTFPLCVSSFAMYLPPPPPPPPRPLPSSSTRASTEGAYRGDDDLSAQCLDEMLCHWNALHTIVTSLWHWRGNSGGGSGVEEGSHMLRYTLSEGYCSQHRQIESYLEAVMRVLTRHRSLYSFRFEVAEGQGQQGSSKLHLSLLKRLLPFFPKLEHISLQLPAFCLETMKLLLGVLPLRLRRVELVFHSRKLDRRGKLLPTSAAAEKDLDAIAVMKEFLKKYEFLQLFAMEFGSIRFCDLSDFQECTRFGLKLRLRDA